MTERKTDAEKRSEKLREELDLMERLRGLNQQSRRLIRELAGITKEFARVHQRLKELRKQTHPRPN